MDTEQSFTDRSVAEAVAEAIATCRQIPTFSGRDPAFSIATAHRAATHLRTLRGHQVVGRKIGFTNRSIWPRYGVDGPMWGDMTDRTVHRIAELTGPVPLAAYSEPKLEPEIALKVATVPRADASDEELLASIAWFAPAFEIVHSIFPGWMFTIPDCVAMGGLHGALYLGETVEAGQWAGALPDVAVAIAKDGTVMEEGRGANALDGPLAALRHLLQGVDALGDPLSPGDIITTGTLTDAQDIGPGEVWTATYAQSPFAPITLRFA